MRVLYLLKISLLSTFLLVNTIKAQDNYKHLFTSATLRIDYYLSGNSESTSFIIEKLYKEPQWGGPKENLTEHLDYGEFRIEIWDSLQQSLLYAKGFSTLFQEWQTTAEAKKLSRSYYQSIRVPYPRREVFVRFLIRNESMEFDMLSEFIIDPEDYFIINETPSDYPVKKYKYSGDPDTKVDLVFLPEGYTIDEMEKFQHDVSRLCEDMFRVSPFKEEAGQFNIWTVESPSSESGTDIPGEGIYKNTLMNFSFYTFDLPRYLTSTDIKSMRDLCSAVPYDHIVVLINTDSYGGGGIYNSYTACTSDNDLSSIVLVHELGHGLAGLADEYYTSAVAYEEFYTLDVEPWEPNLTTLVNFDKKWKHMVHPGTPVPTPNSDEYEGVTGVFEGGGYLSKGVFRPAYNCRMKSNESETFCEVCQEAIKKIILYYSEN